MHTPTMLHLSRNSLWITRVYHYTSVTWASLRLNQRQLGSLCNILLRLTTIITAKLHTTAQLWDESTGVRWILFTKGQWRGNYLHDMLRYTSVKGRTVFIFSADSRFAPSQWETVLLCSDVSHWLGATLESALVLYGMHCAKCKNKYIQSEICLCYL